MATYNTRNYTDGKGLWYADPIEIGIGGAGLMTEIPVGSWAAQRDLISSGPRRELIRDSFGVLLEGGEEGQRVKFTIGRQSPLPLLTEENIGFNTSMLAHFSFEGVVNGGQWIRDCKGNFLPRESAFLKLCRCSTVHMAIGGSCVHGNLFHSAWLIFDCRTKQGRLLAIQI